MCNFTKILAVLVPVTRSEYSRFPEFFTSGDLYLTTDGYGYRIYGHFL